MCNRMKNMYVYVAMYRREPEYEIFKNFFFERIIKKRADINVDVK